MLISYIIALLTWKSFFKAKNLWRKKTDKPRTSAISALRNGSVTHQRQQNMMQQMGSVILPSAQGVTDSFAS